MSRLLRTTTIVVLLLTAPAGGVVSSAPQGVRSPAAPASGDAVEAALAPAPERARRSTLAPQPSDDGQCPQTRRARSDRRDLEQGPKVHVVYMVPSDRPADSIDVDGTLQCSVEAFNTWFSKQSGGSEFVIDRYRAQRGPSSPELVDITFIKAGRTSTEILTPNGEPLLAELADHGLDDPRTRYLVYVSSDGDGTRVCGFSRIYYPGVPGYDGRFGAIDIDNPSCHPRSFGVPGAASWTETVAVHELLHSLGAVQTGAPHSCPTTLPQTVHVCSPQILVDSKLDPERADVMFAELVSPLEDMILDRDRDDYFGHANPAVIDVADSPYIR